MKTHEFGEVIETFTYDFEGEFVQIVKLHPWNFYYDHSQGVDASRIEYYCGKLGQYGDTLFGVLIAWIAFRKFGSHQNELVEGIVRMLKLDEFDS